MAVAQAMILIGTGIETRIGRERERKKGRGRGTRVTAVVVAALGLAVTTVAGLLSTIRVLVLPATPFRAL